MAVVGADVLSLTVPQTYRSVVGPARDPARPRTEGQACDPVLMPFQPPQLAPGRRFPDADHSVIAGAGQLLPVGAEGDTLDGTDMALQAAQLSTRNYVPQTYGLVIAGRRQQAVVGAESDAVDAPSVAAQPGLFALKLPPQLVPFPAAPSRRDIRPNSARYRDRRGRRAISRGVRQGDAVGVEVVPPRPSPDPGTSLLILPEARPSVTPARLTATTAAVSISDHRPGGRRTHLTTCSVVETGGRRRDRHAVQESVQVRRQPSRCRSVSPAPSAGISGRSLRGRAAPWA